MNPYCLKRIENLQARLRAESLPGLLVTDVFNVTYLSGFTGDSSWLWVTPDRILMLSDTRYSEQLAEECPGLELEIRGAGLTTLELAQQVVGRQGLARVGIEAASMSRAISDQLAAGLGATLVPTQGWVEELRAIKDASELEKIRRSIAVNEQAFRNICSRMQGAMSEREVGFELEHEMRKLGADRCAFTPIVGVGPRAALPHARLTHRRLDADPFVLVDWGASVDGYASDLTRVLLTGTPPPILREIYDITLRAQKAAIDRIRPGVALTEVDRAARGLIADSGYGEHFGHGLGHGFGLQIHESPFVNPSRSGMLKAGMVVTVEPGIYLPGVAGVRIEDDVLVTEDGCERLSSLDRELEAWQISLA